MPDRILQSRYFFPGVLIAVGGVGALAAFGPATGWAVVMAGAIGLLGGLVVAGGMGSAVPAQEVQPDEGRLAELTKELDAARAKAESAVEIRSELEVTRAKLADAQEIRSELEDMRDALRAAEKVQQDAETNLTAARREMLDAEQIIRDNVDQLSGDLGEQMAAVEQTTTSMTQIASALQDLASNVEALASSAEESSSSILEMLSLIHI